MFWLRHDLPPLFDKNPNTNRFYFLIASLSGSPIEQDHTDNNKYTLWSPSVVMSGTKQAKTCQGYNKSVKDTKKFQGGHWTFRATTELSVTSQKCCGQQNELGITTNFQDTIYVSGPSPKNHAYYIKVTKGMSDQLQTCRGHQRYVRDTRYVTGVKEKCIGHSRNVSNTTD